MFAALYCSQIAVLLGSGFVRLLLYGADDELSKMPQLHVIGSLRNFL